MPSAAFFFRNQHRHVEWMLLAHWSVEHVERERCYGNQAHQVRYHMDRTMGYLVRLFTSPSVLLIWSPGFIHAELVGWGSRD